MKTDCEHTDQKWTRIAGAVASMLLEAVPEAMSKDLISRRETEPVQILFRLNMNYQPGGLGEKRQVLEAIES